MGYSGATAGDKTNSSKLAVLISLHIIPYETNALWLVSFLTNDDLFITCELKVFLSICPMLTSNSRSIKDNKFGPNAHF